ncbi:MAG TPA: hypothetical protein VFQ67_06920 [Allosphingosinicella sp.]|nr:hypothetical protein [Allosphingosinicella sp.]
MTDAGRLSPGILPAVWWLFTQILGYLGAALVIYSVIAVLTTTWEPVEKYAPFISALLTIVGVMVTAASVYTPPAHYHPPWRANRLVVAPIIIGSCFAAIAVLFKLGELPAVMVNGFAMLGLSGGLQRLIPTNPDHLVS